MGDNQNRERPQSEFRRRVSSTNQIQLPECLVRELGFVGVRGLVTQTTMVAWYYHEGQDKAVLASDAVERPSLALIGGSTLYDISIEELRSGDVSGSRVTIISDLPDHLHERLTDDQVVLKPLYKSQHAGLTHTCVSVYPAKEYDNGELSNVTRQVTADLDEEVGQNDTAVEVSEHINSV